MSIIILYENQGEITKNGVIVKGNSTFTPLLKVSTMAGAHAPGNEQLTYLGYVMAFSQTGLLLDIS